AGGSDPDVLLPLRPVARRVHAAGDAADAGRGRGGDGAGRGAGAGAETDRVEPQAGDAAGGRAGARGAARMIDRIVQLGESGVAGPVGPTLGINGWLLRVFFRTGKAASEVGHLTDTLYLTIFWVCAFFFVLLMTLM